MTTGEDAAAAVPPEALAWVERLHAVGDELVAPVVAAHRERLQCRAGCNACCSDDLSVFTIEAAVIRRHHAALLATELPHAEGACAFLGAEGECRIYEHRPYVCRTQGLPLRWLERDDDGEAVEARDVCPLNAGTLPPLEELAGDVCWTLGPFEERLGGRQAAVDGGRDERVLLRSLFAHAAPETRGDARRRLPLAR
ncbi:MAG: hypothetical protein JWP97_5362 [Labilithrix sp.]|nr:hypothetical protein [Labilithrix sp.]